LELFPPGLLSPSVSFVSVPYSSLARQLFLSFL